MECFQIPQVAKKNAFKAGEDKSTVKDGEK